MKRNDTIDRLKSRVAELETKVAELERDPTINEINISGEGVTAFANHPLFARLARSLADWYVDNGGENYAEVQMTFPGEEPLTLTVQRCKGKTPHQLRVESESRLGRLERLVESLLYHDERGQGVQYDEVMRELHECVCNRRTPDEVFTPQPLQGDHKELVAAAIADTKGKHVDTLRGLAEIEKKEGPAIGIIARRDWMPEGAVAIAGDSDGSVYCYRDIPEFDSCGEWQGHLCDARDYLFGQINGKCYRILDRDEEGLPVVPRSEGAPGWAFYTLCPRNFAGRKDPIDLSVGWRRMEDFNPETGARYVAEDQA